jgi:crotonobetainyl-CoA:carnitine CoA-transferase CaiB-like acyl-CoA transferase
MRFSDTPVRFPVTPPRLGQHTQQVLESVLGLESGEIDDLVAHGIVRAGAV